MRPTSGAVTSSKPPPDRLSEEREAELKEALKEIHPRLIASVTRLCRDPELAKDITQDACLAVILEYRKGTVFQKPVIVFATVVARNKLNSHYRRLRTQLEMSTDQLPDGASPWAGAASPGHDPAASLEHLELLAAVRAAIAHERQCTVWELTHVWGLTGVEIAHELGLSPSQICKDLKKAEAKAKRIAPL